MSGDSVTVSVDVAVDPGVAFEVFTTEIDAWYKVGPESVPDVTRTLAIRFEPHVGGRLLDVHDLATGEGREMGRVTAWEPGRRLAFRDEQGTEVEVSFQARGGGTRVTLTHRGLDQLPPDRHTQLGRSQWADLAPWYRDHLAPSARPFALAVGSMALVAAIAGALWLVLKPERGQASLWIWPLALIAVLVLVSKGERWLVGRWLRSGRDYERMQGWVLALVSLALLVQGAYDITRRGAAALPQIGVPLALLLGFWSRVERGPAGGRSFRKRAPSIPGTFAQRHPDAWLFVLLGGAVALTLGLFSAADAIDGELGRVLSLAVLAVAIALGILGVWSSRRRRRRLGFNPNLFLAVERRMSEDERRPELLLHQASKHSEYSGWYAYAGDEAVGSNNFVVWSLGDLIDCSPEAAEPLREGAGRWRWDQAHGGYRRMEQLTL